MPDCVRCGLAGGADFTHACTPKVTVVGPTVCAKCGDDYTLDDGYDDDGLCHPCAHLVVEQVRARVGPRRRDYRSAVEAVRAMVTLVPPDEGD